MSSSKPLTAEEFRKLFRTFRRSAFRLETLPRYSVGEEDESIRRFLAGDPPPEPNEAKRAWLDLIRSNVAVGKRMQRVHLVRGALTDDLRWEIGWGYPPHAAAGEEIGILHVSEGEHPELGTEDFWLFDDSLAVLMWYGPDGEWLGQTEASDPEILEECRRKKDLSVGLAIPLSEYLRKVGAA
jgi:hypothetical protein